MSLAIATRYARALADIVFSPGAEVSPQQALEDLKSFESLVSSSVDFKTILMSPAASAPKKRAIVSRFAAALPISTIIKNFLLVVVDHRRIGLLKEIRQSLETQIDERTGVIRAEIHSARSLEQGEQLAIEGALTRMTGKQIRSQYAVDPDLIGGVTARVGSRMFDGSVRGQLAGMRRKLVPV
jgi:F-type H+-transporting ATPase subunit delta